MYIKASFMTPTVILRANKINFMAQKTSKSPIGSKLLEWRKARKLTQVELGELLGVSQRMITYYENDAQKLPAHLLPRLARALGVSVEEILGDKNLTIDQKAKPNKRILKQVEKLEQLPSQDRRMVFRMIETLSAQNCAD